MKAETEKPNQVAVIHNPASLIFKLKCHTTAEQGDKIKAELQAKYPGVAIVILGEDIDLVGAIENKIEP